MEARTTTTVTKVPLRYFEIWNGRDETAIDDLLADEFVWVDPLLPTELDNLEGAHMFLTGAWAGMSDLRFELIGEPVVDAAGERVAQEWRMLGTHDGEFLGTDATHKSLDTRGVDVFTVDDRGRVTELRAYYDAGGVLGQLGLL
jgi:steroid delta-isomerase-like uncharacterized protein